MQRWNGWGDEAESYPLSDSAFHYLEEKIGAGNASPCVRFEEALAAVPYSRLDSYPLIHKDPEDRLRHARGQSLPDWIALRSGKIDSFPDGVAYPASDEEVRELIDLVIERGINIIPFGGGTSVLGHINPPGDRPSLTVDLRRLNHLLDLDKTSRLATLEAGMLGPQIENSLRKQGFTLGHFPQSFEYSSLGGWIATRSSGQQSDYYGRIEDLFAGGHVESPAGPMDILENPASAAGPDLLQIILGSEGRFGVITKGIMRVRPIPEAEGFYGVFFRDWEAGVEAIRQFSQSDLPLSMVRLSDAQETETTLRLSEKEGLMKWASRGMSLLGYRVERCLLVFAVTGKSKEAARARDRAYTIAKKYGALVAASESVGDEWRKKRFKLPYLRNTLWERGYALDTLETAVSWSSVQTTTQDIKKTISEASARENRPVLVFSHLSHVYPDGASIYVTYIYPRSPDPEETLQHWRILKTAASETILAHGGTISHQHGIGRDHAPFLEKEKGVVGMRAIQALCEAFDPPGVLNQGVLVKKQPARE